MDAADLFADRAMAAGYAADRPPVHPRLVDRLTGWSGWRGPVARCLDVGCGAGVSTRALAGLAAHRVGIDPYPAMVDAARRHDPDADFLVGAAEALPVETGSVDLLAAAGSLNYADVGAFLPEAARVLRPDGRLAVTNYSFGRPTADGGTDWVDAFAARWPRPPSAPVTAATLTVGGFRVVVSEEFTITLPMSRAAYVAYVMTETSVASAIAAGATPDEIRRWVDARVPGPWAADVPVRFGCSMLVLVP